MIITDPDYKFPKRMPSAVVTMKTAEGKTASEREVGRDKQNNYVLTSEDLPFVAMLVEPRNVVKVEYLDWVSWRVQVEWKGSRYFAEVEELR